jgi:hypothetical protein
MLDGNEKQNFYSLMRLRDVVVEGSKPLVFWLGAGTSRWCGYPSWDELGAQLHFDIFPQREPLREVGRRRTDRSAEFAWCLQ